MITIIVMYLFLIALFIYGTFNDIAVDKALFNYTNQFGVFMEKWGMLPQFTIQLLAYSTLVACYHTLDDAFDIAISLFPFFKYLRNNKFTHGVLWFLHKVMYVAFGYGAFMGSNELLWFIMGTQWGGSLQDILVNVGKPEWLAVLLWTVLRITLVVVSIVVLRFVSKKNSKLFELMACAGLLMFYGGNVINTLKHHFHRIRFREMIAYSHGLYYVNENGEKCIDIGKNILQRDWIETTDFKSYFTRWYVPGDAKGIVWGDQMSFPSGHTSASSYSMLLIPLFAKSKKLNKLFSIATIFGFGYVVLMGLSRMIKGAHYLTDVSGAAIIMLTIMLIAVQILSALQNKSDLMLTKEC